MLLYIVKKRSLQQHCKDEVMYNGVVTNFKNIIMPCNQEEADMRLLLHVSDACKKGFEKVTIITVDTDIAVISLYYYFDLQIDEFWLGFAIGEHGRWLYIHEYTEILGGKTCRALLFWYAFRGWDTVYTVSMFSGHGKRTAWNA